MRLVGGTIWHRLLKVIDEALPMPPEQRRARDDDGRDHSADRRRRLRIHLLEKRGRGGCR